MTAHNTLWLRISKLIDSVASCTKSEEYDEHILECHQLYCDVVNYLTGEGITFGDYSEPRSSTEVLTNTLIETLIDPNNWVARGKVVDEKGDGIEGLVVSLYDQDHLFDDQLGTTQTDTSGQFLITYTTQDFRNLFEGNPDLYIKVVDQQDNILYSSESAVNAGAGRVENFGNININRPGSGE